MQSFGFPLQSLFNLDAPLAIAESAYLAALVASSFKTRLSALAATAAKVASGPLMLRREHYSSSKGEVLRLATRATLQSASHLEPVHLGSGKRRYAPHEAAADGTILMVILIRNSF